MAHAPDENLAATVVTIRHRHNQAERQIAADAAPFFVRPGGPWELVADDPRDEPVADFSPALGEPSTTTDETAAGGTES